MNFTYTVNPGAKIPTMLIDNHIGMEDGVMGIDGSVFQRELKALENMEKDGVDIQIITPGGSVLEAWKIYSAILNSSLKPTTYCMGLCASSGGNIFQAGHKRVMADYGKLMYHNASGDSEASKEFTDSCATMVASRTGKSKQDVLDLMAKTTWVSANQDAINNGFCDEILYTSDANVKRIAKLSNDAKAILKESRLILNSINSSQLNNTERMEPTIKDIKCLYSETGVMEGLEVSFIKDAIVDIKNKLNTANGAAKNLQDINSKLEVENSKLKAEVESIKNSAADELKKAQKESAKQMVGAFEEAGKITAKAVDGWVDTCEKLGLETVKAMLDELPINKVGAEIVIDNKVANVASGTNAASRLQEIKASLNKGNN